jgi:thiosulfate/3-mercaptopyruvate sulfurtransferase
MLAAYLQASTKASKKSPRIFVLTELLGYPRVRNDDGPWTEYGSLVGFPVETGTRS